MGARDCLSLSEQNPRRKRAARGADPFPFVSMVPWGGERPLLIATAERFGSWLPQRSEVVVRRPGRAAENGDPLAPAVRTPCHVDEMGFRRSLIGVLVPGGATDIVAGVD